MSDQENGGDQAKAERFVAFYYAEIKDLAKHFLTLISATIVLSITFADKIVPFTTATTDQKAVLIAVWIFLLASLLLTGLGLFQIFLAAEKASGSVVYDYAGDFQGIAGGGSLF